jgi:osmotically-inducible protein OsmY
VDTQTQSDRVQTLVKGVPGVKSVTSKIFFNKP